MGLPAVLLINKEFHGLRVIEKLGQGGMAEVYKAVELKLDREVAIKFLRSSTEDFKVGRQRFEIEAKALAKLRHPNIVSILDYGEFEGQPYLVMEYIPGGTLKQKLGEPMPFEQAATLLAPVARALHHAHGKNIVHRDVKPSNIMITEEGEPMLSDFGVAKIMGVVQTTELTGTSVGIGTPHYMSPEQGRNKNIGPQSDIYSLGVVFYELITGRKPYEADTPLAVLLKHIEEPIPNPRRVIRDLPERVEQIVQRALAKDPRNRYADMLEMASALDARTEDTFRRKSRGENARRFSPDIKGKRDERQTSKRSSSMIYWALAGFALVGSLTFLAFSDRGPAPIPESAGNLAIASDVRGDVQFNPSGQLNPQPVTRGEIFEPGEGATVEVVGDGYIRLELSDNSIISLGSNTKIELRKISNSSGTQTETHIYLLRGKLLVNANIPSDRQFIVFAANSEMASQVEGTIMGVFYDPSEQLFQVDCLEGHCVILDADGNEVQLSEGELGEILGIGNTIEIKSARYEFWQDIADRGLLFTLTPSPTNANTPSATATPKPSGGGNAIQPTKTDERGKTEPTKNSVLPSKTPANTPAQPTETPHPPTDTPLPAPPSDTPVPSANSHPQLIRTKC